MKTILITGFEPFGGDTINPALEAVKQLSLLSVESVRIITCEVPVVRYDSIATVIKAIEAQHVDAVITVGQAGGRMAITPERVAINVDDYRIKDNAGNQVIDDPVIKGGPAAYLSTLPIKAMVRAMRAGGVPAEVSNTAGTYICNHLFYGVSHYLAGNKSPIKHGFVHIPLLPEQVTDGSKPCMTLDLIVKGLSLAAIAIADNDTDIIETAGLIC